MIFKKLFILIGSLSVIISGLFFIGNNNQQAFGLTIPKLDLLYLDGSTMKPRDSWDLNIGTKSYYGDGSHLTGIPSSMVYPGAGIPISTGSAWGTSITNNSTNWNTAYGWGNHAGLYLPLHGTADAVSGLTITAGASISGSNTGDQTLSGLGGQPALNGTGFVKISGTTISYDNSNYLTSLSGAVLTSQATPQTIGDTTNRLAKLWATDITVTNKITGSITGNADGTSAGLAAQYIDWSSSSGGNSIANKPTLGTWASKNYPTWSSGTPFLKMTADGTFALDTNTYLTSLSGALLATGIVAGGTSQSQTFNSPIIAGATTDPSNGQDILYSRGTKMGVIGNKYSSGSIFFANNVKSNTAGAGYLSSVATANVGRGAVEIGQIGGIGGVISFLTGPIQTSTDGGAVTIAEIARFSDLHKALLIGTTTDATGDLLQVNGSILSTGLTVSGLTSGRVPYTTTGGLFTSNAKFTFDGDALALNSPSTSVPFSVTMPAASNGYWTFSRAAGYTAGFLLRTNGTNPNRWLLAINSDSESGSDAGSNFAIFPCNDSGDTQGSALIIYRATGSTVFNEGGSATQDVRMESDTEANMFFLDANADTDGAIYLGGTTNGLKINKGGEFTMLGTSTVWDDIQFPISTGKVPASNAPNWETFTTNTEAFAFSVDDKIQLEANEPPHGWKEGTLGQAHIHFALKSANSSGADRFAKFELVFAYSDYNGVWTEQTAITQEQTIPNAAVAKQSYLLGFSSTVTLTGLHVGSQITCRVRRIAATGGTEYADDVYITQVGVHVEEDTIGSKTSTSK